MLTEQSTRDIQTDVLEMLESTTQPLLGITRRDNHAQRHDPAKCDQRGECAVRRFVCSSLYDQQERCGEEGLGRLAIDAWDRAGRRMEFGLTDEWMDTLASFSIITLPGDITVLEDILLIIYSSSSPSIYALLTFLSFAPGVGLSVISASRNDVQDYISVSILILLLSPFLLSQHANRLAVQTCPRVIHPGSRAVSPLAAAHAAHAVLARRAVWPVRAQGQKMGRQWYAARLCRNTGADSLKGTSLGSVWRL